MSNILTKTTRVMAMATLIAGSALAPHAAQAQQAGIKRTDLQRHDLSVPGREAVQVPRRHRSGSGVRQAHPSFMSSRARWNMRSRASRR